MGLTLIWSWSWTVIPWSVCRLICTHLDLLDLQPRKIRYGPPNQKKQKIHVLPLTFTLIVKSPTVTEDQPQTSILGPLTDTSPSFPSLQVH